MARPLPRPLLHPPAEIRTQAQALIEEGRTRIDGRGSRRCREPSASAHHRPALRGAVRVIRVLALPLRRGPAPEARACYEELGVDDGDRPA
jgi:ribosome-associated heat shock protein Hsp15